MQGAFQYLHVLRELRTAKNSLKMGGKKEFQFKKQRGISKSRQQAASPSAGTPAPSTHMITARTCRLPVLMSTHSDGAQPVHRSFGTRLGAKVFGVGTRSLHK